MPGPLNRNFPPCNAQHIWSDKKKKKKSFLWSNLGFLASYSYDIVRKWLAYEIYIHNCFCFSVNKEFKVKIHPFFIKHK